ncbi:hypothetical protein CLD22_16130 [Rubrivivax gelatinosus]|nr:hypothetical protein [Rubrivivax gelatinosus]
MSAAEFQPSADTMAAQCAAVLTELRDGPRTTADFHRLCILAPARRVMELRRAGYTVETQRDGRQARYVLMDEVRP